MKNLLNKENVESIIRPLLKGLVRGNGILLFIGIKLFDLAWFVAIGPFLKKHQAMYQARIKKKAAKKLLDEVNKSEKAGDLLKAVRKMNRIRQGKPDLNEIDD